MECIINRHRQFYNLHKKSEYAIEHMEGKYDVRIFNKLNTESVDFSIFVMNMNRALRQFSDKFLHITRRIPTRFYRRKTGIETFSRIDYVTEEKPSTNYLIFYNRNHDDMDYVKYNFTGRDHIIVYAVYNVIETDDEEMEQLYDSDANENLYYRFTSNDILQHTKGNVRLKFYNKTKDFWIDSISDPNFWVAETGRTCDINRNYAQIQINDSKIRREDMIRTDYCNMGMFMLWGESIDLIKNFDYPQLLVSLPKRKVTLFSTFYKNSDEINLFIGYVQKYVEIFPDIKETVDQIIRILETQDKPNFAEVYASIHIILQDRLDRMYQSNQIRLHPNLLTN